MKSEIFPQQKNTGHQQYNGGELPEQMLRNSVMGPHSREDAKESEGQGQYGRGENGQCVKVNGCVHAGPKNTHGKEDAEKGDTKAGFVHF